MLTWIDTVLVLLVLSNLFLLGSSRLASYVRVVGFQGVVLGILTLAVHQRELGVRVVALALTSTLIKSALFPWLLNHAIETSKIKREVEPLVGYALSLVTGTVLFGFSSWLSARLPLPAGAFSGLVVPVSFFMLFSGIFLIVSRCQVITQVISYIVIENGVYLFGVAFLGSAPMLVELGVLLDITVAIFIMGIMIHHIGREFDSLNVNRLASLKDWEP